MNPWLLLLFGWAVMAFVMSALWLVQRWRGDAGIVDVAWGLGVGCLAALFTVLSHGGDPTRSGLIAILALVWSVRLSAHIFVRLVTLPEDGRYQALKDKWGAQAQRNLFLFFQVQAFWSVLFAAPMLLAAQNPVPVWTPFDIAGITVWLMAIVGEGLADRQLSRFRLDPKNRGKVCRDGMWRYSRHPNYFFEWIHWWAYVLLAIGGPAWWGTIFGPLFMIYFLFRVTGIPPTEAQALKSRGDAYRDYQNTTSVFFPWPPKPGAQP
jgi:steroid 5-alpha reductase family enzyme